LYGDEWEYEREREGYRWQARQIGPVIGASLLGATVYELPPGQKSFPYHYEYGKEWLLVIAGARRCGRLRASTSSSPETSSRSRRGRRERTRC
jgi:uncharacterized cupin superfamily protein